MTYTDPYTIDYSRRDPDAGVDPLIWQRFSPRQFKAVDLPDDILISIMDAARWAPSCYNEQPWQFLTADRQGDFQKFLKLLKESNQEWACNASVLGFVVSRRTFAEEGRKNPWMSFDTGAAWMALTYQARLHGLYTHGMGGINKEEVYTAFELDKETVNVICGFAIGVLDEGDEPEIPNTRKPLADIWKTF